MHKLQFTINIQADKATIWQVLWDDASYRAWTSVFFPGSYAVSDNWKQGTTVMFLSPDKNGMYSTIESHIPNEFMAFRHIGNVKGGVEQPVDDATRKWTDSTETYQLTEGMDGCTLTVETDTQDGFVDFMNEAFPKALEKVKVLAEIAAVSPP